MSRLRFFSLWLSGPGRGRAGALVRNSAGASFWAHAQLPQKDSFETLIQLETGAILFGDEVVSGEGSPFANRSPDATSVGFLLQCIAAQQCVVRRDGRDLKFRGCSLAAISIDPQGSMR